MKSFRFAVLAAAVVACGATAAAAVHASTASHANVCPNGKVRFGVEPYDTGAKFTGAYKALTKTLAKNLGCSVSLVVTANYTQEVEAMRAGKLDVAEFGPLGYIFAHKLSHANIVSVFGTKAHKPVTYFAGIWVAKGSPITSVADLAGHSLALSDPASTSGNLYPLYALITHHVSKSSVHIEYAGGHPESMLALTNGKVDAAEVNSQQEATGEAAGTFDPSKYTEIWKSTPIPNDPITVRSSLPVAFQSALKKALFKMTPKQLALVDTELGVDSGPMIPAKDSLFKTIRSIVKLEHLKISAIG
jgi:phosphonate transport system substrate-binding protein